MWVKTGWGILVVLFILIYVALQCLNYWVPKLRYQYPQVVKLNQRCQFSLLLVGLATIGLSLGLIFQMSYDAKHQAMHQYQVGYSRLNQQVIQTNDTQNQILHQMHHFHDDADQYRQLQVQYNQRHNQWLVAR